MEKQKILAENKERHAKYFGYYDPYKGEGSLLERFSLEYEFMGVPHRFMLPMSMQGIEMVDALSKLGSLEALIEESGMEVNDVNVNLFMTALGNVRLDHDFEYWAAVGATIQSKKGTSGGKKEIPFVLNYPQRVLLLQLETMRLAGVPIRIVLLKARQWGGSTLTQIYMAWLQVRHFTSWHSIIMADVENQSRNIRGMYTKMAANYPDELGTITLRPYEGSQNTRIVAERGCIIAIGSVQKPENVRSYDFAMAHLSEIGLWKDTPTRSADDLAQALAGSIPSEANTLIVKESTAKGVGNYFHNEWIAAEARTSGYAPVFIPWYVIPMYIKEVKDVDKFLRSMTEYDWWQWEQGATLEGINWYRTFKASERYSDWRMQSEFPTTSTEAFQSTGRRVFSPFYTVNAKRTCIPPLYKGDVYGNDTTGKGSLKNIQFAPGDNGNLFIWAKPDDTVRVANRYCGFADIGGRTEKADYSVLKVFDRYWMMDGGVPEVVAIWHGHIDQDLFAWKCAQIMRWYNNGLLAIETNSLGNKAGTEGDHSFTILDEIAEHYDNLFTRVSPDRVREGIPQTYGFHTNHSSKGMIIDTLNAALREKSYIERDIESYYEMDYYEYKPDGKMGAVDGRHDDRVIVTAGGVWLCLKHMEAPRIITEAPRVKKTKVVGEASF